MHVVQPPIALHLDALAAWRVALGARLEQFSAAVAEHGLFDDSDAAALAALRERLASDKLVLAFVAEFSRGKSELINALFFADTGRRVLPATPGRTTMCPVELRCDAGVPPSLKLLPIETRLGGQTLGELRGHTDAWQTVPLDPADARGLAQSMAAVTLTRQVSIEQAAALGLWNAEHPDDNPPQDADGRVEVPAWRHALINYPHPLLKSGLVVIDTPGLNALGAEPELTLGLLPSAHAIVFVLGADTGVTRSDMAIWREHLGQASLERFVVLNKIDTLADPLATPAAVEQQIEGQRESSAQTLGVIAQRIYPLSARGALAARVAGDQAALLASRLPQFEQALVEQLLPRRQQLLVQAATGVLQQLRGSASRRLADRRRQRAEQLIELRGLRGKSGTKLRLMVERVDIELADFERCSARLHALRLVHQRMLRALMAGLSSDSLRLELAAARSAMSSRLLGLGAKPAFEALFTRLGSALDKAGRDADEIRQMLEASFLPLNSEFGFAFAVGPRPGLGPFKDDLALIASGYSRYLALGQAWRLSSPAFAEPFMRMLTSKLRVVFENAASALELWSKGAGAQIESQLSERRRGFVRRRESLERVQTAASELESRIQEVQDVETQWAELQARIDALADAALRSAGALHRSRQVPPQVPVLNQEVPAAEAPHALLRRNAA
jgi:hypothetical protein